MPLSTPELEREPIHTRAMECRSFRRADGLWDIEGHLTDVKSYPFLNDFRGEVKPGEPLHDMWLRLTVDGDFVVRTVEAVTDAGPHALCPAILPSFRKLEGMRIGPGWNRGVRETLGGALGCTHLVDLLRPIATVAFHTLRWSNSAPANRGRKMRTKPPLDTCHVWASDGELIRTSYPEYWTGGSEPASADAGDDA